MLKYCWVVLSLLASFGLAAKDNDYYFPGYVNPNTENKMYWKDSINVLQDLDQFESLYIKYHHCVWSRYGRTYGSGSNYDEQGADQDDADEGNGCGGWGGEYFWYMGRTQCFKANVAFSLYGVLKGEEPAQKQGSFCHAATYINSFFTTYGVESFTGPLGMDVYSANAECSYQQGGGNNNDGGSGDNSNGAEYYAYAADDDYLDDNFEFHDWHSYTSQGTGCSASGQFVTDQYEGAFCSGKNYVDTVDTLDSFNEALETLECTQIYDSSGYYNNGDGERRTNQVRGRQLDEDEEDYDFEDMEAVQILSFSKSCSLRQYPNDCPDPHGIKKKYARKAVSALNYKTGDRRNLIPQTMKILSCFFLLLGIGFANAAFLVNRGVSLRKLREKHLNDANSKSKKDNNNNKRSFTPPTAPSSPANDTATPPSPTNTASSSSPSSSPKAEKKGLLKSISSNLSAKFSKSSPSRGRSFAAAELIVETPLCPKFEDKYDDIDNKTADDDADDDDDDDDNNEGIPESFEDEVTTTSDHTVEDEEVPNAMAAGNTSDGDLEKPVSTKRSMSVISSVSTVFKKSTKKAKSFI